MRLEQFQVKMCSIPLSPTVPYLFGSVRGIFKCWPTTNAGKATEFLGRRGGTTPERPRRVVQQARDGAHEQEGGEQRGGVVEAAADVGGGQADELELVQGPLEQAAQQRQSLPPAPLQSGQHALEARRQPGYTARIARIHSSVARIHSTRRLTKRLPAFMFHSFIRPSYFTV